MPGEAGAGRLTPPVPRAPRTPGQILREARLRRRLSLADVEQATRIRQRYLQAMEDDDYSIVPPGGYSWGFLRNYAIFLGVPPEDVMGDSVQRRRRDRRTSLRNVATPVRLSAPRSIWLLAAGGVIALIVGMLIWLGLSSPEVADPARAGGPAASPTSRVTLPPLAPATTPTTLPTPALSAAPSPSPAATSAARQVEVELRTTDRAWVRATVDGRLALEETLAAGQVRRWTGQQLVALRVGNGGGVDVTVNGQRIGALGPAGQPVDREFALSR
jgi:cytoskeletal protein RodZ